MTRHKKTLTIFTSLPPSTKRIVNGTDYGAVYQRMCIDSWIGAGFDVVSLNSPKEIEALEKYEYPIRFIESTERRPLISELLTAAASASTEIVGLINADCFVINYEDFISSIRTASRGGLVMVERVNIDPTTLHPTGKTCLGFDAFFFNRTAASSLSIDEELAVGQPWWDYWLPLEFAMINTRLLRVNASVVFHLDHDQGWSQGRWLKFGRKLSERIASVETSTPFRFPKEIQHFLTPTSREREDLGGFGDWCFNWLRDNAQPLELSKRGSAGDLLSAFLNAFSNFDGMHETTLALAKAQRDVSMMQNYLSDNLALKAAHDSATNYVKHLEKEVAALKEGHTSAEIYVRHLEAEIFALKAGHTSAETYAGHLEKQVVALKDAHTSAETHALHLEREIISLREAYASRELYTQDLQSSLDDLRSAHADAERHVEYQDGEIARLTAETQRKKRVFDPLRKRSFATKP